MTNEHRLNSAGLSRQASPPLVAISILNWNGWRDTLECLESVRQLQYPNYLTVVADNGSGDDSAERIKAWTLEKLRPGRVLGEYTGGTALLGGEAPTEQALEQASSPAGLVLIRNQENLGFAGGNNVTIHYALTRKHPADFVFLLNNDSTISPRCLTRLVETIQKANAGIAEAAIFTGGAPAPEGPWLPPRWQILLERLFGDKMGPFLAEDNFREVIAVRGTAMLIRAELLRALFSATGEYLPNRFFMYLEDVGISLRARKLGYRCIWASDAEVLHKGGRSAGGKYNPLEYYYQQRNGIFLAKESSGATKLIVHVIYSPKALGRIAKSLLHRRPAAARAILAGLIDGYRGVGGKWKHHDREIKRLIAAKRAVLKP